MAPCQANQNSGIALSNDPIFNDGRPHAEEKQVEKSQISLREMEKN